MSLLRKHRLLIFVLCVLAILGVGLLLAKKQATTTALLDTPDPTFHVPEKEIPASWTLIAYGDMRFTNPLDTNDTNPKVRRWLVEQVAAEHPDAVLLSGDLPFNGFLASDYAIYRAETESWRKAGLRIYPALGNHELRGDQARGLKNWWDTFPELKGRRWYSVQFGNAYVITLDSSQALTENSEQQKWIAEQLDHLPRQTQFVFFSLHHPPVADPIEGNHSHDARPNEQALATLLEKRAASAKVKFIVIAGHIHNYERFFENGVMYLVSGGGGAKPYPIARTKADLYQDPGFPNYHYVKFVWDGKQLKATMFRVADSTADTPKWEAKDSFEIEAAQQP